MIDANRESSGFGINAFLEGFTLSQDYGPKMRFQEYFDHCLDANGDAPQSGQIRKKLEQASIEVQGVWSVASGTQAELDKVIAEIRAKRIAFKTYKHDTQVKAEAEVALMVASVRRDDTPVAKGRWKDGYFVSPSRVIDNLDGIPRWIGLAPEGLIQWLATTRHWSSSTNDVLFELVLYELADAGVEVVPQAKLSHIFATIIDASKDRLQQVIEDNVDVFRELYGTDPDIAFRDVNALEWPDLAYRVERDIVRYMKNQVAAAEAAKVHAEAKAVLTEKQRKDLDRLKAGEATRKARRKRRARREASKPKKKKKHKRKE